MRPSRLTAILLALPLALGAAPTTKKASTRPAGETDGSGPRAALLLMDKMTLPGKPETALPFYHATATRERVLAGHLAKMDAALTLLHHSAGAKFGRDAADMLVKVVDGTTVADINAAKITVEGDRAKVWFKESGEPTVMVRVGDEWKISVKQWVRGVDNLPALRTSLDKLAAKITETAKGIDSGRYASAEACKADLLKAKEDVFPGRSASADDDDDDE